MNLKKLVFLIVAVVTVSMVSGCSLYDTKQKLDSLENTAEQQLDIAEKRVEDAVMPKTNTPSNEATNITPKQAQATALEHAGFSADQVTALHTEYETDDAIAHYDVKFRHEHLEYEYEIHAQTGEIISFESDD